MKAAAQTILDSFDHLPQADQEAVAREILRRSLRFDFPPLTDEEFAVNAEQIFLELDREEE